MSLVTTATATTATTTAPLSTSTMSLSSSPEMNSTSTFFEESVDSPNATMPSFTPGQCLFCAKTSPSFADSVVHMQKSHGLFVPHLQNLAVDLETLFQYLHLVIFGYRECIQCGTQRSTIQAVQQHMTGKGHCKFDVSEEDSEFAEFYDFSEPEGEAESDIEGESEGDETNQDQTRTHSTRKPLKVDQDSIRLPSGKIISRQSSTQAGPSFTQLRRRTRTSTSQLPSRTSPRQLEYLPSEPDDEVEEEGEEVGSRQEELDSDPRDTRILTKREKRERAAVTHQLTSMRAGDRNGLVHLPTSQQRALLATQHRQAEKVQKEERRRQTKIDRKGNKNLYAYWHTETPVYQCG